MKRTPAYREHRGFLLPQGFPAAAFDSALGYEVQPGDVFLAAYPKCGTTWTQYMAYLLLHEGLPLGPQESLGAAIPHLEEVGADALAWDKSPRVIKTHLSLAWFPYSDAARYVYIARNPFDCVVSFYHHTRGFPRHYDFADGRFDDFFECFLGGTVDFGDYFDHLVPWSAYWERPNVLLMLYEDMRTDPAAAVRRLARFLRPDLADRTELLDAVLRHSSFASMREHQARWSSPRPAAMPGFVRKGIVGDWRDTLSRMQIARLLERWRQCTRCSPAANLWPEIMAEAEHRAARSGPGDAMAK